MLPREQSVGGVVRTEEHAAVVAAAGREDDGEHVSGLGERYRHDIQLSVVTVPQLVQDTQLFRLATLPNELLPIVGSAAGLPVGLDTGPGRHLDVLHAQSVYHHNFQSGQTWIVHGYFHCQGCRGHIDFHKYFVVQYGQKSVVRTGRHKLDGS